jgi:nitrate reductase gamma subunit
VKVAWWSEVLWVVLPYVSLTLFVSGHLLRYATDRYGWGSHSTQLLERRILRWASPLFHYGILLVFLGHVAGILVPLRVYGALGVPAEVYHAFAIGLGGVAGAAVLAGLGGLVWRRFTVRRVRVVTSASDWLVLGLLLLVVGSGWWSAVGHNLLAGPYEYRATIAPWFRGIVLLRPQPELLAGVPFVFRLHLLSAFVLLAAWPFTRLVHVWSLPLAYLNRATILYRPRALGAARVPRKAERYRHAG